MNKSKTYSEWQSSIQGFDAMRHANCCRISYEAGQQSQQVIIDDLKAQLNNMEWCYIGVKKERDELLDCEKDKRIEKCLGLIESLYREDFNQRSNANIHISQIKDLEKALRGEHD